jgi:hypothetical protein
MSAIARVRVKGKSLARLAVSNKRIFILKEKGVVKLTAFYST